MLRPLPHSMLIFFMGSQSGVCSMHAANSLRAASSIRAKAYGRERSVRARLVRRVAVENCMLWIVVDMHGRS